MEIRGHFDIASGEMPTEILSAGQVLSGLACVAGDDERHRPGTIGLQEPRL
ncbi:hypothetical protein [Streptomyces sp. NPDC056682]|uniref:hypothetical protein n=1 Tax=Streptomyces sp. NPDC056682 TaxID=3345909 RepID=UPI0036BB9482